MATWPPAPPPFPIRMARPAAPTPYPGLKGTVYDPDPPPPPQWPVSAPEWPLTRRLAVVFGLAALGLLVSMLAGWVLSGGWG